MLRKLHPYIAFTLLANATLIGGLLTPAHAKSAETIESRNFVEKLALNPSQETCATRTLRQGNSAEIYSTQSNQGEVIPSAFTSNTSGLMTTTKTTGIGQQNFVQLLETYLNVSNGSELDLDSVLANEFEQEGILLAKCCAF
ncbi:hypothetical protein [Iningainema tapete]|uniref:Uncharacterized protein n=1 Tax=Iningainema tapete BLCC-T55 TaxID=2748662 RepID=A0A8J7BYC9_9CYAN|nr:hypothetical protein [Iningainema tapete]MBD2775517.1 hypothetical protein [Iningainema tapete BLCC-T55]